MSLREYRHLVCLSTEGNRSHLGVCWLVSEITETANREMPTDI